MRGISRFIKDGVLSNRQFFLLFSGNTAMFFGFYASILLRSLIVWDMTADALDLAYINVITAVCLFSASLVAGPVVDRVERRKLILMVQLGIIASEILVMTLYITAHLTFPLLMISAVVGGASYPFIMPARTAMISESVARKDLRAATAYISTGSNIARTISPACTGILVASIGHIWAYAYIILMHISALIFTFKLGKTQPKTAPKAGIRSDLVAGFAYLAGKPSITVCIVFSLLPLTLSMSVQNLAVAITDELWGTKSLGVGFLIAAMGLGGVIGALLNSVSKGESIVRPMTISSLLMALCLIAFPFMPSFSLALVLATMLFACSVYTVTLSNTAIQLMTDDHIRGRITSISLMSVSLAPLGTLPIASAIEKLGADTALQYCGILLLVSTLSIKYLVPSFRNIDDKTRFRDNT